MAPASDLMAIDVTAALPARARERLAALARPVELAAGETSDALAEAGLVLFVMSGALRVSTSAGGKIAFQDYRTGGAAGLVEAVSGAPPGPRAVLALEAAAALALPAAPLLAAIASSAPAAFALAQRFAKDVNAREPSDDPLQRIFRDLLRAARPLGEAGWTVDPLPRHRDIAERAGVAEEAAASAIAHLVRLGVARRRYPALDIEDRDALKALAG
ncbi:hypothetical protein sos41_41970 [Alphaproteobacteria bacterium SO-S41]|nr:hypothetical protein sos41_41970 [Alphaproteobacteria bacterium SO-S41]